ncbi:MAG: TIGR00300 family protein, partial [Nitrososphaerales archaeon]
MSDPVGKFEKEVEVSGHLIDSMVLTQIFDKIMDLKGEFEVLDFKIGKSKKDPSYVKLLVKGRTQDQLQSMLDLVYGYGAVPVSLGEVQLMKAPKDMVVPETFYSTTHHPTEAYHNGRWLAVESPMMDKVIVIKARRAACRAIRDIKKGDQIVVGADGLRVRPPERPRSGMDLFEFMSSKASTEKPIPSTAKKIAEDFFRIKKSGGKIAVVAGPAVVHTGATESLSKMIKRGWVDVIFAGNALAVHDVENALFGTSLGIDVSSATSTTQGHRNHMAAINEIFRAGSLADAVKAGKLQRGIMYECIKNNVPFVLAGSLRDDG